VQLAWRLAVAGWANGGLAACARLPPRFDRDPFSLGVASGAPRPDGFVIWTRLAPEPWQADGAMPAHPVDVSWEVAEDPGFSRVIQRGISQAHPERAHAVHVSVSGLAPERWYHYRFRAGAGSQQAVSTVGRSRTAPAPDSRPSLLRFAFASCQQYEQGHFGAYRHMADDAPDLVVFLGDYIYESSWGRERVRAHAGGEPRTLDGYRLRHAQYRTDPDLQRMHGAAPWILTWDDHEVDNDYAGEQAEDLDPDFLARRAAAYRAYFEHLPLPAAARPDGASMQLYERYRFGRLAEFMMLDDRQYRSPQACPRAGRGGSHRVDPTRCPTLRAPARSMLGAAQERWLEGCLSASRARWNLLGQQTLFSTADRDPGPGESFWTDGWDGYPAARRRLIEALRAHRVENPLFIGGDMHANWVCDVQAQGADGASGADRADLRSGIVATEFCGTSITSQGRAQAGLERIRAANSHIHLAQGTHRGYGLVELRPSRCTVRLRVVDDVRLPEPAVSDQACFEVKAGQAGAHRVG
jgi:alkaline phosphatase D